ncbi:hypothetical protein [Streptomyces sp. UH6]|uniref:hypothetical protein n=1 Tax=Streptomyces sp. UH6 TaxID=2748379 RepID=UPI0015D4870D|nr:hypothetical protein [Streptomyces sp. UH6]NYV78099.1 hypothetical protein [Streptomyces sp. UH6]
MTLVIPLEPGAGAADLRRGVEALSSFKKRVDAVLDELNGSPANPNQVASLTLTREALAAGSAFGEAVGLYSQYARAHERVSSLSRTLGLQIEALQIAVHGADIGFDNLEEESRRRFHEIQVDLKREADREQDLARNAKRQYEGGF